MSIYHYLSLIPEALIASMLPPHEFGSYLAVGTQKRTRGQALFFSLDVLKQAPFDLGGAERKCVAHPNGEPKHSVYVSVYRVLERIPLKAIRNLFMVTPDGRVLEIEHTDKIPEYSQTYHLYQEICPVHPRVVSTLSPQDFTRCITDPTQAIHVPRICFADLNLGELAEYPDKGSIRDLPYYAIEHLRDCLVQLQDDPEKHTKIVDRIHPQTFPYRSVSSGVFLGSGKELLFWPFPTEKELQSRYYEWWRSASIMSDHFGLI
ncbi:MAG: hypothetical protein JSV89_07925 [Spirochaetaceae bacterium]|nr:MAG: hypothetical protein JSV89_07925 [Spirochaetaceae bacterium]